MTTVLTPFAGPVVSLADVPDPVFAGQLVGAGVAVDPTASTESITAVAPVDGTIVKLHPHAFALQGAAGTDVLVHVGIDTVKMAGEGFELLAAEGDTVAAGDPVVRFTPATILAAGYSPVCPVVVLGSTPDSIAQDAVGTTVAAGDTLFEV
ncbi:PTS system N-acetylglucosamine-specific IIA component (Glc family) [Curtobacterium sp. PhB130]|uniref:PTS sugar transporter subunit IIA n=1 Tax=unclassified Curtobacterium TaxID=257496 RepID=UPI000F4CECC6|nr:MULTISPECIES: glucose PTS transporter subunit IIA [unclassified Curtobacterium]ROS78181.1 PTS system N-acetylglucosamine-specific IIA component (Glc family) [Curtobacterium sp. PhB130]TCK65500.1 PTS system N-acetylglucosamine-specific IIA component (Glc family) [Curtobacterium sp. PhB136]